MGKHTDKLGSIDDFKAPWETEAGQDAEIDKPKLRRLIFNLKLGEAKALDAKDEQAEALEKAEKELEEAKDEAANANGDEAQKKIDRLQSKVDKLQSEIDSRNAADELAQLRADVLGDFAEKHPKAAKYVKGETQEELEKSLEEVKEDWGITDGDGDKEEEDEPEVRTRPQARTRTLTNGADKESGKPGEKEVDFDAVADGIVTAGNPFR